jgi:cell division protein FtsN
VKVVRMTRRHGSSEARARGVVGHPMLIGVLMGVLAGLCLALGVALYLNKSSPFVERGKRPGSPEVRKDAGTPAALPSPPARPSAPVTRAPDRKADAPQRFDFYKILPGTEEAVSERDLRTSQPNTPAREVFYLQAGAFQRPADADNLKARLALAGLEAQIQTAMLADSSVWHRVRLGPFANPDSLDQARAVLRENQIEPAIIKVTERDPKR